MIPWGNPYYSPWGKPCGAQSPYFPPWGKPWDTPWGKPRGTPRIHVPQGFPPGEKYVFLLGGRPPPRGNPWAGPHFLWEFRNGKTILEKSAGRFGAKWKSDAPKRCGLGILPFPGSPPGENPEETPVKTFLGNYLFSYTGFPPWGNPWGKVGPPWGKVGPPHFPP